MSKPPQPPVEWVKLTAPELNQLAAADALVILPVASTEQHGPHLGTGVDTILCGTVCRLAAERAQERRPVVVAPTLWVGLAEHHMAHGGTFTLDIPTYRAVLVCLVTSLQRHGFRRVLIVNGHGGNASALNAFLPDITRETGVEVAATTYFELAQPAFAPLLDDQDGVLHACEAETSMMMLAAPDAVREDRLADAHGPQFADPRAVLAPPVQRWRSFKSFAPSGVIGDARRSSRAKGEKLQAAAVDALADVIVKGTPWA
ncbi:creatininase family protein [Phreatobacter stygius]|uniref:Creatininase family protein n=1 Tax=Phreatobacter stygius TaxID=1940610 RepID=A0A4D7AVA5_9HYPH|nr:creatininase family protein [Phreatobacter stygius]QCI63671.1 creatininase family protein [Phreatobacter stygius]